MTTFSRIAVNDLSFQIGQRVVLDALSFVTNTGVVWLRGPNGTGKTTLLKLLGGALVPTRGEVRMGDRSLSSLSAAERVAIFFCGDDLPQLPWLTARELVAVYVSIYPGIDRSALDAYLDSFNLMTVLGTLTQALSLGERRKVQLAVALAVNSSLLLLDEPFNALDASATTLVRDELQHRHATGAQTIILTSHTDPGLNARICDLRGGPNSSLSDFV